MKVGIYNQPAEGGIGGSEVSAAVLAEALVLEQHQIDIVHHKPYLNRERLAEISNTDLSNVRLREVAVEPFSFGSTHNPWRRYEEAVNWQRALSEPYDLFINFTHGFPPFCHARRGALVVLFPFNEAPHYRLDRRPRLKGLNALKDAYHKWEWRKRLASYHHKTAISQFSRDWTMRRWGVDCEVIYPPVDTRLEVGAKENVILSVGRFTVTGHSKKQLEMMTSFSELEKELTGWEYYSIGGVSGVLEDAEYFNSVASVAKNCRAHVVGNLEPRRLSELYGRAKLFWHAAGYDEDDSRPELSEHFGIATVEAMSAGCVPVVIDKGGQREIIEHGVSGFLWNTLQDLKRYTELLVRDEQLRAEMGKAARSRAATFSRTNFVARFKRLLTDSGRLPH